MTGAWYGQVCGLIIKLCVTTDPLLSRGPRITSNFKGYGQSKEFDVSCASGFRYMLYNPALNGGQ